MPISTGGRYTIVQTGITIGGVPVVTLLLGPPEIPIPAPSGLAVVQTAVVVYPVSIVALFAKIQDTVSTAWQNTLCGVENTSPRTLQRPAGVGPFHRLTGLSTKVIAFTLFVAIPGPVPTEVLTHRRLAAAAPSRLWQTVWTAAVPIETVPVITLLPLSNHPIAAPAFSPIGPSIKARRSPGIPSAPAQQREAQQKHEIKDRFRQTFDHDSTVSVFYHK